ncbi:helix-turn-helix domain-containing protein [Inhella proteolytica]|uniref:Helix-turn-helix transcriptional regulator n=1 Tax=Inhella proteolytica TaxID=2795029 RepID=A0A931J5Z7_9BURK|nr:helix-turn-helix transcriptional regulator [Inhella proteolytica]MBH9578159.1 helix-turn-helix transcriptional regulator [Inhella proteolytica]
MIRCHLSTLLGERKLKIADVARDTGVNRGTLTRMYQETAERFDSEVLDVLCAYFQIELQALISYMPDEELKGQYRPLGPRRQS